MYTNRNLTLALMALWCYTRNCNINLANNSTILLIVYALLSHNNGSIFGTATTAADDNLSSQIFRNAIFPTNNQQNRTMSCCQPL